MRSSMREYSGKMIYAVATMIAVMLAAAGVLAGEDDWGPFTGPWERYEGNPIIAELGANPGSILRYKGKLWMIVYSNEKATTRLAVSEDGYDWEYVHEGRPILEGEGGWEGSYAPTKDALIIDDMVYLYYIGKQGVQERIGVATASNTNLFKADWVKHPDNPVFSAKDLSKDVQRVFPDCVLKEDGKYYMFFDSGYDYHHPEYPRQYTVNVAVGEDGVHFEELADDLVIPGHEGSWESQSVCQAAVRKVGDWWYMIYSGFPKGPSKSAQAFGLARARKPEGPWEKYPGNPIFTATGNKEDWDGEFLQHACPVKIHGKWHLYYAGNDLNPNENVYRTGVAIRQ